MPLSDLDRDELDRLGVENVRLHLELSPGPQVPSLGKRPDQPFGMPRRDIDEWLVEQAQKPTPPEATSSLWNKTNVLIGIAAVLVAFILAVMFY
jgi:hypothetical protein